MKVAVTLVQGSGGWKLGQQMCAVGAPEEGSLWRGGRLLVDECIDG